MLREIHVNHIRETVAGLIAESAYNLPADYLAAMQQARETEASDLGGEIITLLLDNAAYAASEQIPTCQDTGMALLFLEIGQDVHLTGGPLHPALAQGVIDGYANLRKSVVSDPLLRQNSGDNTPPITHIDIVPGDQVRVTVMMKGFGAELMSQLKMMPPSVGAEGVKRFVVQVVEQAGPNACPPLIVGVGIGGSFDTVSVLAKKALLRPLGQPNPQPHLATMEAELLTEINRLGIGPQGLGGSTTALAVHVEVFATHIAALPVAVNLNCSAPRRASKII
ncbi:MAG: fumarate hydratase [Caldilineaceae bacterium]